jgi:hypothetical protein
MQKRIYICLFILLSSVGVFIHKKELSRYKYLEEGSEAMEQHFNNIVNSALQDNTVEEGIMSRAFGAAALAGALGFGSPAEGTPIPKARTSQIQNQKDVNHNIITRTLWAEARNSGEEGMREVASTIYNRGGGKVDKMVASIKVPKHYSCWNGMTPKDWANFKIVTIPGKEYEIDSKIADELVNGTFKRTSAANHYYNPTLSNPKWAYVDKTKKKLRPYYAAGGHRFMNIPIKGRNKV